MIVVPGREEVISEQILANETICIEIHKKPETGIALYRRVP
jgi:hypothetical protein